MTALAAILALALAAGPSDAPRRTADSATNATRARAGLLPRKAARTHVEVRRLRTVSAPAPTFLGEPAPLADASPGAAAAAEQDDADWVADAPRGAPVEARHPVAAPIEPARVVARARIETVRLRESEPAFPAFPAFPAAPAPVAERVAPPVVAPEELGAVRVALLGVSTEVTLRLRLDQP